MQILETAAPYMTEETNVIALVMFISSSDWLEAMRLYADPEWQAVTDESTYLKERLLRACECSRDS
jgi:hypothetical protein